MGERKEGDSGENRPLRLEAEPDFSAAPVTGWTRRHWEEAGRTLLRNALAHAEPGASTFPFPDPRREHRDPVRIESFARVMLLAGPLLADRHALPDEGERARTVRFFREGLLAGTDPNHPGYWGAVTDTAQHLVELPSIAWFLWLTRPLCWDTLSESQRQQIAAYLARCNRVSTWDNNWMAFDVVTNAVLKRLGMPYSEARLRERLHACDALHAGGGWYRDRANIDQFDFYNFWVFHRHMLQWAVLDGDSNPQLAEAFVNRADQALADLRYFVAADGATPFFGRSLTYRFAFLGPIAQRQQLGPAKADVGELRTLASLTTKFFCDRPILTRDGYLSLGYLRPCNAMLEEYSFGGSPYWACAAFDLLLLPEDHAFWQAREAVLPIHRASFAVTLHDPGFLVLGEREGGHVQLLNQKSVHFRLAYNAKYTNFAYSSAFLHDPRNEATGGGGANALEWSVDGEKHHQRHTIEPLHLGPRLVASRSRLSGVDGDSEVTTFTVVKGDALVNVHRAEVRTTLYFRESGYTVGFDGEDPEVATLGDSQAVVGDGLLSYLRGLVGYESPAAPRMIHGTEGDAGCGPSFLHSATPVLHSARVGPGVVYLASLVCGRVNATGREGLDTLVTSVTVRGSMVSIRFNDGETVILNFNIVPRLALHRRRLRGTEAAVLIAPDGTREVLARHRPWTEPAMRGWARSVRRRVQCLRRRVPSLS